MKKIKKINTLDELKLEIAALEIQRANEREMLKEQVKLLQEHLKPMNLIKDVFSGFTHSDKPKVDILGTIIGMATGYITKKVVTGSSLNPLKRIAGTFLQTKISNSVATHGPLLKSLGMSLFKKIVNLRKDKEKAAHAA